MPRKKKPASSNLPAPVAGSALASAANLSDDSQEDIEVTVPFMGFFSKKSNRAGEIKAAIPSITDGAAFVCYNSDQYELVEAVQVMDGQHRYFSKSDSEGQKIAAGLQEAPKHPDENVLAVVLCYTSERLIATVSEFRKTKVRCVRDFVSAAHRTTSDGWADRQGPIGQQLAGLPPRLRVVGEISLTQKTSKAGNLYHLGRCNCKVPTDKQVQMLVDALQDEDFDASVKVCLEKTAGRWKWLNDQFINAE
jgi:hypothetical protein